MDEDRSRLAPAYVHMHGQDVDAASRHVVRHRSLTSMFIRYEFTLLSEELPEPSSTTLDF
jgi:hypothetical protein